MFWSRKTTVAETPVRAETFNPLTEEASVAQIEVKEEELGAAVPVEPEVFDPPGTDEEVQAYVALCQKIGAETPAVRMLQLEQFLAKRGIPEYDPDRVHAHLCKLATKAGGTGGQYAWHPLRQGDIGVTFYWYFAERDNREFFYIADEIYHELVPSSVLETVATILGEFPDAKFFVSDISDEPDPFLLVTFPDVFPLIVDFWNEPDFRPS